MKKIILIAILLLSSTLLFAKEKNTPFNGQLVEASCAEICVVFVENPDTGKIIGLIVDANNFADVAELHSAVDSQVSVHLKMNELKKITGNDQEKLQDFEQSIPYYYFKGSLNDIL